MHSDSQLQKKLDRYFDYLSKFQKRWRWVGYILSALAVVFIASIIVRSSYRLQDLDWDSYLLSFIKFIALYLVALLLQFVIWSRMLSSYGVSNRDNFQIYAKTTLMRQLPGRIWHWVGRATMYASNTKVSGKTILLANFTEWILNLLTAGAISSTLLFVPGTYAYWIIPTGLIGCAIYVATIWQPKSRELHQRLLESIFWVGVYIIVWIIAGLMFFFFIQSSSAEELNMVKSIQLWVFFAGFNLLLIILPTNIGIKEITLSLILHSYIPIPEIIMISILIRLAFAIGDIFWGGSGWLISSLLLLKK
jgi:hypothetical protein